MNTEDSFLRRFLVEDYKLKVQYLTDHFSRMWTRFNFFLTINSALFAFSVQKETAAFVLLFVFAGLILSALWYFFGATDNYLVDVYRKQVGTTYYLLGSKDNDLEKFQSREDLREVYSYVGDIKAKYRNQKGGAEDIDRDPFQWRYIFHEGREDEKPISATELAVILPFAFLLLWLVRFVIFLVFLD
jgi:hypothetical protein